MTRPHSGHGRVGSSRPSSSTQRGGVMRGSLPHADLGRVWTLPNGRAGRPLLRSSSRAARAPCPVWLIEGGNTSPGGGPIMMTPSLRGLAVAAIAACALAPAPAGAVTQLNDCAALTKAGETYVLTADVIYDSVCFRIQADR